MCGKQLQREQRSVSTMMTVKLSEFLPKQIQYFRNGAWCGCGAGAPLGLCRGGGGRVPRGTRRSRGEHHDEHHRVVGRTQDKFFVIEFFFYRFLVRVGLDLVLGMFPAWVWRRVDRLLRAGYAINRPYPLPVTGVCGRPDGSVSAITFFLYFFIVCCCSEYLFCSCGSRGAALAEKAPGCLIGSGGRRRLPSGIASPVLGSRN